MKIKKGDFIEIDYVGRLKDSGQIFDLTKKDIAEKEKVANKSADYSPKIICVGAQDIVKGLDDFIVGKETGKSYSIELDSDNAFGKKNPKLIKMMPLSVFKKQKLNPFPGLQINIDGMLGIVRTCSGGRVLVDFNHPLSGREVVYEIDIKKIINKDDEKIKAIIKGLINKEVECNVKEGKAIIDLDLPEQFQKLIEERIKSLVTGLKKVEFKKDNSNIKKEK
jgi:FKBP-type peptidyl-prolyl cis-trans isomerase SlyD